MCVGCRSGRTIEYPPRSSNGAAQGLTSDSQNSGHQMASICRPEASLSFLFATMLPLKYTVGLDFVLFCPPARNLLFSRGGTPKRFRLLTYGQRTRRSENTRSTLFTTNQTTAWKLAHQISRSVDPDASTVPSVVAVWLRAACITMVQCMHAQSWTRLLVLAEA